MASLFGAVKRATYRYARIVYNGVTVDLDDPLQRVDYQNVPQASSNISQGGTREVLFDRMERGAAFLTPLMDATGAESVWRFIESWGGRGEQFELYVDRLLRAFWGFQQHPNDNNGGNPMALCSSNSPQGNDTGTALSFVALTDGYGISIPSPAPLALRASLISRLAGGSTNAFVSATAAEGGTCVLRIKPDWAFADSAEHVLWEMTVPGNHEANRLRLVKRADNVLHGCYVGANGADTIVQVSGLTWSANTEHTILLQWGALADLTIKVDGVVTTTKRYSVPAGSGVIAGSGTIAGATTTTPSGNEQTLATAPTRLTLGVDDLVLGGRATGSVGMLALYRALFGLPASLDTYRHPWRSYYPKAELVDANFTPLRVTAGRELFTYTLRCRDGA